MLGKTMQEAPPNAVSAMEKQEKVKLAILRASRFSPWRTRCFEQAIAAKIMLGKRHMHSTVYFGVFKNDDSEMCAHAWLVSNDAIVTGGPKIDHITVLSWFGS